MDQVKALLIKMNLRERILLVAILIVVALIGFRFTVVDEFLQISEIRKNTEAVEAEIARSRSMLSDLASRKPASFTSSPLFAYKQENSGLGNLILRVSNSAESSRDFVVRRIALEKNESLPEFEKNSFQLEVEGPFHSIGNFLQDLEESRFLTRVESVQVFRIEKELRLCRARILVSSFSWREP